MKLPEQAKLQSPEAQRILGKHGNKILHHGKEVLSAPKMALRGIGNALKFGLIAGFVDLGAALGVDHLTDNHAAGTLVGVAGGVTDIAIMIAWGAVAVTNAIAHGSSHFAQGVAQVAETESHLINAGGHEVVHRARRFFGNRPTEGKQQTVGSEISAPEPTPPQQQRGK